MLLLPLKCKETKNSMPNKVWKGKGNGKGNGEPQSPMWATLKEHQSIALTPTNRELKIIENPICSSNQYNYK